MHLINTTGKTSETTRDRLNTAWKPKPFVQPSVCYIESRAGLSGWQTVFVYKGRLL